MTAPTGPQHTDLPWDLLVQRAAANTAALSAMAVWRRDGPRTDVDLDAGTVVFSGPRFRAVADLQVAGTLDRGAGTWLWAWDHPSVPAGLARDAAAVRTYGERHALDWLTSRLVQAGEPDAARFTDVTALVGGANGVGVIDAGTALLWFTHGPVRLSAPDDAAPSDAPPSAPPSVGHEWYGPDWMRGAGWVGRGNLEDPVPMRENGIPASGPWLTGPEPAVTDAQVVAFMQSYNEQMHPLYHLELDADGDAGGDVTDVDAERQAALRERYWRRTDTFHQGAVRGSDGQHDPAVTGDWFAARVAPRTWQVTWTYPLGPLGRYTAGVVVVAFDDGLRIADLLEAGEYH